MERCEERCMLSGDGWTGTIALFDADVSVPTEGGFFYRLDQAVLTSQFVGSSNLYQPILTGPIVPLNSSSFDQPPVVFFSDSTVIVADAWSAVLDAAGQGSGVLLGQENLHHFLPKPEITRIPLVPPAVADRSNLAESVISLARLLDANRQTHETELLAIRSDLLAAHLDPSSPVESSNPQAADRIVLQEAESSSTWDRVWSFEPASFSLSRPSVNPNDVPETSPAFDPTAFDDPVVPNSFAEPSMTILPASDSLSRLRKVREEFPSDERTPKTADAPIDAHTEALAELDQVTLSSGAWSLATDRRGDGLVISVVALLAAQRIWNASSGPASEEKEEPPRNTERRNK